MDGDTIYKAGAVALGAAVVFVMMALVVVGAAFGGTGDSGDSGGSGAAVGGTCDVSKDEAYKYLDSHNDVPPEILIPVYQGAAAKFGLGPKGPDILAAINEAESTFGRSTAAGVRSGQNSAGASGPMQIGTGGAAGNNWPTYAQDGNGDGKKDVYDPADAIFAAAKYMKMGGAPGDWQAAIYSYNHADWYVADVLEKAEGYNLPEGGPC